MSGTLKADLSGRRALVTGASSGLGQHFALVLAGAGADVVIAARRIDRLEILAGEITGGGGSATPVAVDVTDPASVREAVAAAGPVDILVNNAGVAGSGKVLDWTPEEWDRIVDTNLKGAWLVASEVARAMRDRGSGGSIINIGSILGDRVSGGVLPYSVSKAGLVQMTKAMALELAPDDIRVNALMPGYIRTDMTREFLDSGAGEKLRGRIPQRRFGTPGDLTGPLLLLASDASRFMTGATIAVDGGHLVAGL